MEPCAFARRCRVCNKHEARTVNSRIDHQGSDQPGAPSEDLTILDDRYALDFPLTYAPSGTAWLATDTFTAGAKRVVVKFLSRLDDADADELVLLRTRFTPAQVQAAQALPRIEDLGGFEAEPFIVFSRVDGRPLDQYLQSDASGSPVPMAALLQFARAVQAMHAAGVLHLDIAPAHLIYDVDTEAVRLLDWGHALAIDSRAPPLAHATEMAIYAGPGLFGAIDPQPRDDVYATACVIYEVLSGQHPYQGRTVAAAAAMQLVPAPIATLTADQNAVLALALSTTGKQPAIDMAQLIAVFERTAPSAVHPAEPVPAERPVPAQKYMKIPAGAKMPSGAGSVPPAAIRSAMTPAPAAPGASVAAASASAPAAAPSAVVPAQALDVPTPAAKQPPAPAPVKDALAARTASIEAMIARDHSSRAQTPSTPDPDLIEPLIAHEYISADDTMPPRTSMPSVAMPAPSMAIPGESSRPPSGAQRAKEQSTAPATSAAHGSRRDPYISSPSLPPASQTAAAHSPASQSDASRGPASSPPPRSHGAPSQPRSHAPFSRPPASFQAPFSRPPVSQSALSQPPLSQPPLAERPHAQASSQAAGPRSQPLASDVDELFRGTEFDRTRPSLAKPRGWSVTLPLGLTITLASCVIGIVAGVWLAGSGSTGKRAAAVGAPSANPPAQSEAKPAAPTPAPVVETKPAPTVPTDAALAKPAAESASTAPSGSAKPAPATPVANVAPAPATKPASPTEVAAPLPTTPPPAAVAAPKRVAPAVVAPAPKPAAPPAVAAPRPVFVPKPAPVANAPIAPGPGVDLLDATMATRALTERVARETEEELARQRAGKQ